MWLPAGLGHCPPSHHHHRFTGAYYVQTAASRAEQFSHLVAPPVLTTSSIIGALQQMFDLNRLDCQLVLG